MIMTGNTNHCRQKTQRDSTFPKPHTLVIPKKEERLSWESMASKVNKRFPIPSFVSLGNDEF
ncbi:hypothetical protein VCR31J2_1440020 [Vibrio coralliirubri]|uniref:Uncharacterized protein n=1 Tax=Vibrio coralliirubri TaxID=1516159 RepID=A0AA86XPX2_9VIBR|nr:hypothetical protein VCR31J2_1440020 [Vibrio coralliirubri]